MTLNTRWMLRVMLALAAVSPALAAPTVQDVVDAVSQTQYREYLGYPGDALNPLSTHAGDNRGAGQPDHLAARASIYNHFVTQGLSASYHDFGTGQNVIGERAGQTRPGDIYIVGAHYDSKNNPGADDDASGVAAIMEMARVFAGFDFAATIRFIAFDREEDGLWGSAAYASAALARGDHILGMVSLDMIAYNHNSGEAAEIYGRTASDALKQALRTCLLGRGYFSGVTLGGQWDVSDHAPFEADGYVACMLTEAPTNPNYHQDSDNVDATAPVPYLDYEYATQMVKGTAGWLAESATVLPEPGTLAILAVGMVWVVLRPGRRARA